jgi:hypothetical protein
VKRRGSLADRSWNRCWQILAKFAGENAHPSDKQKNPTAAFAESVADVSGTSQALQILEWPALFWFPPACRHFQFRG